MPRFRPAEGGPEREMFDFIEQQPAAEDGWRFVPVERLVERNERFRSMLTYLMREGHILRDSVLHVLDFEAMNPDFGRIEEVSREKARLLESMIRFVESLPTLPL